MKKIVIYLTFLLLLGGCESKHQNHEYLDVLVGQLSELVDFDGLSESPVNPLSAVSSFDNWGKEVVSGIDFARKELSKSGAANTPLSSLISQQVPVYISEGSLSMENSERASLILNEFLRLYRERDVNTANYLSFEMESIIISTKGLRADEMEMILKMVSVIRHVTYYLSQPDINGTKGSGKYEKCWKRKLQEMEDSGIFTKLVCVWGWPVCFGALALDCVVEVYI